MPTLGLLPDSGGNAPDFCRSASFNVCLPQTSTSCPNKNSQSSMSSARVVFGLLRRLPSAAVGITLAGVMGRASVSRKIIMILA